VVYPEGSVVDGEVVWPYVACIAGAVLSADIQAALNATNAPTAENPFATIDDLGGGGSVDTVNGVSPDENKNVQLTPGDIGAEPARTAGQNYISDEGLTALGTAYDHSQAEHAPANADNTAENETSHVDVLVDGDIGVKVQALLDVAYFVALGIPTQIIGVLDGENYDTATIAAINAKRAEGWPDSLIWVRIIESDGSASVYIVADGFSATIQAELTSPITTSQELAVAFAEAFSINNNATLSSLIVNSVDLESGSVEISFPSFTGSTLANLTSPVLTDQQVGVADAATFTTEVSTTLSSVTVNSVELESGSTLATCGAYTGDVSGELSGVLVTTQELALLSVPQFTGNTLGTLATPSEVAAQEVALVPSSSFNVAVLSDLTSADVVAQQSELIVPLSFALEQTAGLSSITVDANELTSDSTVALADGFSLNVQGALSSPVTTSIQVAGDSVEAFVIEVSGVLTSLTSVTAQEAALINVGQFTIDTTGSLATPTGVTAQESALGTTETFNAVAVGQLTTPTTTAKLQALATVSGFAGSVAGQLTTPTSVVGEEIATTPAQVTGVTVVNTTPQLKINWNDLSDETSYEVYYSTSSALTADTSDGSTTYPGTPDATAGKYIGLAAGTVEKIINSGLTASTTYYVRIRGVNAAGNGVLSDTASAAAAAVTLILDDFARANSADLGSNWQDMGVSNTGIVSNQASGSGNNKWVGTQSFGADQYAQVQWVDEYATLFTRIATNGSTYYHAGVGYDDDVKTWYCWIAKTGVVLVEEWIGAEFDSHIKLEVTGTTTVTLTLKQSSDGINWNTLATTTDSTSPLSATGVGFGLVFPAKAEYFKADGV
jgi:hypothetical protein